MTPTKGQTFNYHLELSSMSFESVCVLCAHFNHVDVFTASQMLRLRGYAVAEYQQNNHFFLFNSFAILYSHGHPFSLEYRLKKKQRTHWSLSAGLMKEILCEYQLSGTLGTKVTLKRLVTVPQNILIHIEKKKIIIANYKKINK